MVPLPLLLLLLLSFFFFELRPQPISLYNVHITASHHRLLPAPAAPRRGPPPMEDGSSKKAETCRMTARSMRRANLIGRMNANECAFGFLFVRWCYEL